MKNQHTVYHNKKGEIVPSVTTVLKIINKPALVGWSNYLGLNKIKYREVLEQSSEIGTIAHKCIEMYLKHKIVRLDKIAKMAKYEGTYDNVMNAYHNFKVWWKKLNKENEVEVISTELRCESKRYGGTIDLILKINGRTYIVDFKTSSDIFPSMYLQLAAYGELFRKKFSYKPDAVGIVRLDRVNYPEYNFHVIEYDEIEELYFPMFINILNAYLQYDMIHKRWGKKMKL